MARFSRIEVVQRMHEVGLVPVFYEGDPQICFEVLGACHRGGATIFELTNRGDQAHAVFAQLASRAAEEFPDLILGAGTVLDAPTAALYLQLGANFVVSPILAPDVARVCNRRKVAWLPGCGSMSEISTAEELGAEVVKIFPAAEVGGPSFVKAVRGPSPWTSIMPTGGVAPEEGSLRAWFEAGVWCVGIGSKLFARDASGAWDLATIEHRTRETIATIARVRS